MGNIRINEYEDFIDSACIKLIKGEFIIIAFILFCTVGLVSDVFDSGNWVVYLGGLRISLYYLYSVALGFGCLFFLFERVCRYYIYTVFNFHFKDGYIVLNICHFKSFKYKKFEIVVDEYRIGHWNGFKKEYFNCVGIKTNKKVYLIPVVKAKQDKLVQLLLDHRGKLAELESQ